MAEEVTVVKNRPSKALMAAIAIVALMSLGALIWCYGLNNHLAAAESRLTAADQKNTELAQKNDALDARLRATTETLGQSVGMTQKQIELKTQSIMAAQATQAAAVRSERVQTAKLAEQQADAAKQIGAVQTDVSTVKTDVSGAKASIADTQTDLAATKEQLQRTIGDAGVMSGLIARNHGELETLKHKGDRSYFEFTLQKGGKPTLLSTVEAAGQEGRRQALQVHDGRKRGRSEYREEGQESR